MVNNTLQLYPIITDGIFFKSAPNAPNNNKGKNTNHTKSEYPKINIAYISNVKITSPKPA